MTFDRVLADARAAGALVVLFGPPGSGKSTRVARLGATAFDMELIESPLFRTALVRTKDLDSHPGRYFTVIGAADTEMEDWRRAATILHKQVVCVLLLPDREDLRRRRARRDFEDPSKAGQPEYYAEFSRSQELYDHVIKE